MSYRCFLAALLVGLWSAAPAAAAQLLVISARNAPVTVGDLIDSEHAIKLAAGAELTVVAENGATQTVSGPFEGVVKVAGPSGGDGLLSKLATLVTAPSQDASAVGAVRGGPASQGPPDPWMLDVDESGHHCTRRTGKPLLWRGETGQASALSVRPRSGSGSGQVSWQRGEATAGWPDGVELIDGGSYVLRPRGSTQTRRLILHLAPENAPSQAHLVVWMAESGCRVQARRLLATLR